MSLSYGQLKDKIRKCNKLYIYGAGVVAYGASEAIRFLCDKRIDAYIVTDISKNETSLAGIDVVQIRREVFCAENVFVLVATPEEYHSQIAEALQSNACEDYEFLTSHLEYCLMGEYLKERRGLRCIEDFDIQRERSLDARVYMAISHNDKALQRVYVEEAFVKKIQVGASQTEVELESADAKDDEGENISGENPIYGELTATYWAWKNDLHDVMGLFHYRRVLNISEEQLAILQMVDADVVLPLPFVCYPDTSGQFGRYVNKEDMQIVMEVLKESNPEEYPKVISVLNSQYLYNYNMLIAKREVYEDYCSWMFPLLEEITKRCEAIERARLTRYIGRIGEVLTSVYFTINRKKWRIIHAEKVWRV